MISYKNSFSEEFLDKFRTQIIYSKKYRDEDYKKKLKDVLKYFDNFFGSNIKKPVSNITEELKKKEKELDDELNKILIQFDVDIFFKEAKKSIKQEISKQKLLVKHYLDEKKNADEILNIIKKEIKIYFEILQEKINNRISKFNGDIFNIINKIKEIINGGLNNNEKYNNYIKELFLSNKILINNSLKNTAFISNVVNNLKYFFKAKNDINVINEKINDLQNQFLNDLKEKKKYFNLKIDEQSIKIKDNFKSILNLSYSHLSNIEEKEWKECISLYYYARKFLLPIENNEKI